MNQFFVILEWVALSYSIISNSDHKRRDDELDNDLWYNERQAYKSQSTQ